MVDNPQEYFQQSFLEDFIDEDEVLEAFKSHYEYDISDSPESYFDLNDFKLTDEQEEEKERLENELYENQDKLNEYEEGSAEYEQIQEHIDYLEEQISEIEPDTEPTQEMIDEKVDDMLDEVRRNLVGEMENFGMSINNYLDTEKLLESLVSDGDYGHLNHWNSEYDTIYLNDVEYIVMNINQ
jgi:chromosome segregation ATPase